MDRVSGIEKCLRQNGAPTKTTAGIFYTNIDPQTYSLMRSKISTSDQAGNRFQGETFSTLTWPNHNSTSIESYSLLEKHRRIPIVDTHRHWWRWWRGVCGCSRSRRAAAWTSRAPPRETWRCEVGGTCRSAVDERASDPGARVSELRLVCGASEGCSRPTGAPSQPKQALRETGCRDVCARASRGWERIPAHTIFAG